MKVLRLGRDGQNREEECPSLGQYRSPAAQQQFYRIRDRFAESHDTGDAFNTCMGSVIDWRLFSFPKK